jgi:hypothetical protein
LAKTVSSNRLQKLGGHLPILLTADKTQFLQQKFQPEIWVALSLDMSGSALVLSQFLVVLVLKFLTLLWGLGSRRGSAVE